MGRRRRCGAYASQIPVAHVRCRGVSKPGAGPACLIHCVIRPRCSGRAPNGRTRRRWCGGGGGGGGGVGARGDDPRGRGRGGGQGRSAEPRCRTFPPSRRAACRMSHVACWRMHPRPRAIGGPPHAPTPSVPRSLHEGVTRSLLSAASRSWAAALTPSRSIPAQPRPVRSERRRHARARRPPCPALPCPSARPAAKFCSLQRPASPSTSAHADAAARADASASASASSSRSGTGDFPSSDWSAIEDAAPLHAAPDSSAAAGGAAADVCRTRRGASDDCTNAVIICMHWHEWCELRVA